MRTIVEVPTRDSKGNRGLRTLRQRVLLNEVDQERIRPNPDTVAVPEHTRIADADRLLLVVQEHAVGTEISNPVSEIILFDHAVPLRDRPVAVDQHPVAIRSSAKAEATMLQPQFGDLSGRQPAVVVPQA